MEALLEFFEQYWGYTLFGGVTVGTLVTFVITAIKLFSKIKSTKKEGETFKETALTYCNALKEQNSGLIQALTTTQDKLVESEKMRTKELEYVQRVQTTTFKAISYLIMSSKLPNEEKINIYEDFAALTHTSVESVDNAATEVKVEVDKKVDKAEEILNDITNIVDNSKTLLDKYTNKEV